MKRYCRLLILFPTCFLLLLIALLHVTVQVRAQSMLRVESPTDVLTDPPVTLVDSGVANITIHGAKVWWWYAEGCAPTLPPKSVADIRVEEISRIATTGGMIRTVFVHEVPSLWCGSWSPELRSNVVADDNHLYWMSDVENGLVRLSVEANPGDPATPLYTGKSQAAEIEERAEFVYLMDSTYGIVRVNKTSGVGAPVVTTAQLGGSSFDLQVSDAFVFWNNNGSLKMALNGGGGVDSIDTGVTSHIAERSLCSPGDSCSTNDFVFLANGEHIRRYDVGAQNFSGVLYDSPVAGSRVVEMTVDEDSIYFFEERTASCDLFCTYDYGLYRIPRAGGVAELLYLITEQLASPGLNFDLTLAGPGNDYLFWKDGGKLRRLPRDAEAIPAVDVLITNIEVTQAIQDLDNSIQLIQDKHTGVRVHVDAAGQDVAAITARLYRINSAGAVVAGPIPPTGGTAYLTVPNNPDRSNFNHAFYFELPNDWIDDAQLRLRAEINPTQLPPEPNYANNTQSTATLTLRSSPTLRVHLLGWGYTVNDTYYEPNLYTDVYQARSWIRRTYPLASTTGGYESPDPGVRVATRTINDPNLGEHVQQTSDFCLAIPEEKRNTCAAAYTNSHAMSLRAAEGIPNDEMIYSMIWYEPTLPFPRGFADGGVSTGPTGTGEGSWDNDGSFGDWYMGHEVGHSLGRNHPSKGNACGHSKSDSGFPHPNAAIGVDDMWGFDVGDTGLNSLLDPRVYPNTTWRDLMSYCNNQWISDYTYEGIYDSLTASRSAERVSVRPARAGVDYIALFGAIYTDANTATFQVVSLWDSPGPYELPVGGPYRMRFLNSAGTELAFHDFSGDAYDDEPSIQGYSVVVPFPAATVKVELMRRRDGKLLTTHLISANAPSISNVQLVGAPNPVTGKVTLQWQANDPDGDPLTYDVYYSDDNGATYTAYALALSTTDVQLDTAQMGGSAQARFRVTANDGARSAEAESGAFSMAHKPPVVVFLTPPDGLEVTYGTAVNFTVEVEDLQGHVPDANMRWFVNGVETGTSGPNYTAYLLPVGTNKISLRAINTVRQATEESVTVIVNDDLEYPGPKLGIGPDQVSWQLAEGTTALQQATVTISNIGTGSLNWHASESASWLSLSTTNGSTPGMLTLTADPTQVALGNPVSTVLTISGANRQTIQLPVNLLVGVSSIWSPPSGDVIYGLFLPISLR